MFQKIIIKNIIKRNRKKYKDYFECLNKSKEFIYIKNKRDLKFLYLVPKYCGIIIGIERRELFNKRLIKNIIKLFPKTEIELYEKEKLFTNDDIKEIYRISKKIIINTQYFEKNIRFKNEVYLCDIETYMLIIQKIEFLNKICKENFIKQDEQFMFILTQILKYIKYIDYHDYRTCMANSILLGTGVCIDFTITLYKCLTDIGIECEIIQGIGTGKKEDINSHINLSVKKNHAWNQVKIDGKWYNVDITWFLFDKKFDWLLSDDVIFKKNNTHLTNKQYHACIDMYDKEKLKNIYEKFMQYDSVWKKFDNMEKRQIFRIIN